MIVSKFSLFLPLGECRSELLRNLGNVFGLCSTATGMDHPLMDRPLNGSPINSSVDDKVCTKEMISFNCVGVFVLCLTKFSSQISKGDDRNSGVYVIFHPQNEQTQNKPKICSEIGRSNLGKSLKLGFVVRFPFIIEKRSGSGIQNFPVTRPVT